MKTISMHGSKVNLFQELIYKLKQNETKQINEIQRNETRVPGEWTVFLSLFPVK